MIDIEMTTDALAERMGWHRSTAHRRLVAIEKEHPGVVRRTGKGLSARASALAPFIPGLRETPLEREVRILREQQVELRQRFDVSEAARLAFQAQAHAWFQVRKQRAGVAPK